MITQKLLALAAVIAIAPFAWLPEAAAESSQFCRASTSSKSCGNDEAESVERRSCVGCHLNGAHWSWRNLRGWDLRNARFIGADLAYADLRGARLQGVDFTGADLRGIRYDSTTHTSGIVLCNTILPSGNRSNRDCN